MALIGGTSRVWHFFTNDVPFPDITLHRNPVDAGKNASRNGSPIFVERMVWRNGPSTANGDQIILQDKDDNDVFKHTREADDMGKVELELYGAPYVGLKLLTMDSGVLDIYLR